MKNIAIIAEYNPLHNGHIYHMEKVINDNNIIVALSGNFTERGDIATQNKYNRAVNAVKNGASMVVEIPTFGVLSCAEHYAKCAVKTLKLLGNIDELSFGSEDGNIDTLKQIASLEEDKNVKDNIALLLDNGESYPLALSKSLAKYSNIASLIDVLAKPNNILGIEYIRALKGSNILPTTIERVANQYNDTTLSKLGLSSATSIRENLSSSEVENCLPNDILKTIRDIELNYDGIFTSLYQKLVVDKVDISNILNISEGIENRIVSALLESSNYTELINNIKTKRYTMSRIKRTLLDILLGIDKSQSLMIDNLDYVTVLAIKRDKLNLLKSINANIVTKYNDYAKTSHPFKDIDLKANNLYNLLSSDKITCHKMNIID